MSTNNAQNKPRRLRMFLVEHEEMLLGILQKDLSDWFDVAAFLNCKAALRYLEELQPDIIVSDLYLRSDGKQGIEVGLEFFKSIRSQPGTERVPIVVLSKYGDYLQPLSQERQRRYKQEGMKFGPGRRYSWRQLVDFQRCLESLGIDSGKIFNKFAYSEYKTFAQTLHTLLLKEVN